MKKLLALVLSLVLVLSAVPAAGAAENNLAEPSVVSAAVDYQTNPVGIAADDVKFSWAMESDAIGASQLNYRIVVRKDSGISSVADMAGKDICVGAVGSGYEVAARQILGAYDMSYDDINETFADQATAKNGIQDGTFDAMFMCSGYPNSNVT